MKIEFLVAQDSQSRHFCANLAVLKTKSVTTTDNEGNEGTIQLDTDEKILAAWPDGHIFSIECKEYLSGAETAAIEKRLALTDKNGKVTRQGERWYGVLVDEAVTSWTFTQDKSEQGFFSMPDKWCNTIGAAVEDQCFGYSLPNF